MKKTLLVLAVIFTVMMSPTQSLQASSNNDAAQVQAEAANMQRSEVIVKRVRVYKGVVQYRRWNKTYGYWVDPDWIDVG